jgi:hypothetical protein
MESAAPPLETHPEPASEPFSEVERVYEIVPRPRPGATRVVGPGRRERAYLEKLAGLEMALAARERELGAASLVERGSTRRLDRMERKIEALREAGLSLEQKEHRLILTLGALQRENEMLRERLTLASGGSRSRALPAKRSWLARLLRRA